MTKYNEFKSAVQWVVSEVASWLWMIAALAIAALFFASASKAAGYPIRALPTMEPTALAYLCGAYWLARK